MKKLFLLALTIFLSTMLFACGEVTTTQAETTAVTTEAETTVVTTALTTEEISTTAGATTETTYLLADMYEGSHDVSAMGSAVTYCYTMLFSDGNFTFHSTFVMADETYNFDEAGTYIVTGNSVALTPTEGTEFTGTIGDDQLTIGIQASSMAARGEQTLTKVEVGRIYVGSHSVTAMGSEVVYVYTIKLAFGTYTYHSMFNMQGTDYAFDETGIYTVDGTTLTITLADETVITGTIGDGTLTVSIQASSMAARGEQTLTESQVAVCFEGTHTVSAMGSDVIYTYTIQFVLGNYTFHSDFTMGDTDYTNDEIGTYTIADGVITMTPEGETAVTGTINSDGTLELPIKASSMATRGLQTFAECVVVID